MTDTTSHIHARTDEIKRPHCCCWFVEAGLFKNATEPSKPINTQVLARLLNRALRG